MNHNSLIQKRSGLSYIADRYPGFLSSKTILVMKLIFIFSLVFCMQVSASSYSQKITLVAQNALRKYLSRLKSKAAIRSGIKRN